MGVVVGDSFSHSMLTPGRPVSELTLQHQAPDREGSQPLEYPLVRLVRGEKGLNPAPPAFQTDALPLGPLDGQLSVREGDRSLKREVREGDTSLT